MDFYERLNKELNLLREIYGKLSEARTLADDLVPDTQQVIERAMEHVRQEIEAATEIWNDAANPPSPE